MIPAFDVSQQDWLNGSSSEGNVFFDGLLDRPMGKSQRPHFAVGVMGNPQDCRNPSGCRKAGDLGAAAFYVSTAYERAKLARAFFLRKLLEQETSRKSQRFAPGSFTLPIEHIVKGDAEYRMEDQGVR